MGPGSAFGDKSLESEDEYDDDDELSIVEYARKHRLTKSYLANPAIIQDLLPSIFAQPTETTLEDCEGLGSQDFPDLDVDEPWTLDHASARFLQECLRPNRNLETEDFVLDDREGRRLRCDSPILRTDQGLDQAQLLHRRRSKFDHRLVATNLAPETVTDQDLPWPTQDESPLLKVEQLIAWEKLQVGRAAGQYLQEIAMSTRADADMQATYEIELRRSKRSARLSPALLPLTPPWSDEAQDVVLDIPFTSTPSDPAAAELLEVDQRALQDDSDMKHEFAPMDYISPEFDMDAISSPTYGSVAQMDALPSRKRKASSGLKMEDPLTPQDFQSSPFKNAKTISFVKNFIDEVPVKSEPDELSLADTQEQDYEKFFDDIINLVAPAIEATEHEQLADLRSDKRMVVPSIKDEELDAPWLEFSAQRARKHHRGQSELQCQRRLLEYLACGILRHEKQWSGTKGYKDLSWVPVPSVVHDLPFKENFDQAAMVKFIEDLSLNDKVDSSTFLNRPACPRIFAEGEDEEEELEELEIDLDDVDLHVAIGQRHLELQKEAAPSLPAISADAWLMPDQLLKEQAPVQRAPKEAGNDFGKSSLFASSFSAASALDRFIQVQTGHVNPTKPEPVKTRDAATASKQPLPASKSNQPQPQQSPGPAPPLPQISLPVQPQIFIATTPLLSNRSLYRRIQHLYPRAQILERDFSTRIPLSGSSGTRRNLNTAESDLLLSPSTGLITTTLQRIKQKPLPGQNAQNGVFERLRLLAERYEKLIMLVSEGALAPAQSQPVLYSADGDGLNARSTNARPLDASDTLALNSLTTLALTLGAELKVIYVLGSEHELATWTVAMMTRYGLSDLDCAPGSRPPGSTSSSPVLAVEETVWERFLRAAGLNAFAAQTILLALRRDSASGEHDANRGLNAAHGLDTEGRALWGLPAFVAMSARARRDRFGALLGGTRVLDRISAVLDQKWAGPGISGEMEVGREDDDLLFR